MYSDTLVKGYWCKGVVVYGDIGVQGYWCTVVQGYWYTGTLVYRAGGDKTGGFLVCESSSKI